MHQIAHGNLNPFDTVNGVPFLSHVLRVSGKCYGCGYGRYVEFNLARGYKRLQFTFGMSDRSGAGDKVHMTVKVDGASVGEYDIALGTQGDVDLDVTNGLRLRMEFSGDGGNILLNNAHLTK